MNFHEGVWNGEGKEKKNISSRNMESLGDSTASHLSCGHEQTNKYLLTEETWKPPTNLRDRVYLQMQMCVPVPTELFCDFNETVNIRRLFSAEITRWPRPEMHFGQSVIVLSSPTAGHVHVFCCHVCLVFCCELQRVFPMWVLLLLPTWILLHSTFFSLSTEFPISNLRVYVFLGMCILQGLFYRAALFLLFFASEF